MILIALALQALIIGAFFALLGMSFLYFGIIGAMLLIWILVVICK